MGLGEKMFCRSNTTCPLRSECGKESDRKYFDTLFDRDWEVFVIRRDEEKGKFDWFTLCCETGQHEQNALYACN